MACALYGPCTETGTVNHFLAMNASDFTLQDKIQENFSQSRFLLFLDLEYNY